MLIRVRCEKIKDGFIPAEKIAYILAVDGNLEEVTVSPKNLTGDRFLEASEVGRFDGHVLIELPRESASGRWRLWVDRQQIGA